MPVAKNAPKLDGRSSWCESMLAILFVAQVFVLRAGAMAHRPAPATSSERQAAWAAGRDERHARLRAEQERREEQLRAGGEADWRPRDWDDEHGAWLVPVPELLVVPVPDLVGGRARLAQAAHAAAEERAAQAVAELDGLLSELGAHAVDVLDEEEADRELCEVCCAWLEPRSGRACSEPAEGARARSLRC